MRFTGKFKLILALLFLAGVICLVIFLYFDSKKTATVEVLYTPQSAELRIGDSTYKAGTVRIEPGDYTLTVKKSGFAEYSEDFTISDSETKEFGIILRSNSHETENWYNENEEDMNIMEIISDRNSRNESEEIVENMPIIKDLPYIHARGAFRIDYGIGSDPKSQALYITHKTDVAKELALDFIRDSLGYEPEEFEIFYIKE